MSSLASVSPWTLRGKRVLGFLSWWSKRRHQLSAATLARVTHAAGLEGAELALVTGDLVHIGLPQELRQAHAWLDTLAATQPVVLVPGNHDCYRADAARGIEQLWPLYLHGASGRVTFPRLITCGEVAIIALSSAAPMPWWSAGGRLGADQLAALEHLLVENAGSFRCVMLHHAPLVEQAPARKALADALELTAVLRRTQVELVLHGHLHHNAMQILDERTRIVVTAPASSAVTSNPASYRVFDITRDGARWQVTATLKCEQVGRQMAVHTRESWSIPTALM